jgi:manganese efflux pump family protein
MSYMAIIVLAISMSMDAFAVSVGRGAAMGRPRFSEALRTGVVFGIVEAITPLIGWAAGVAAAAYISAVDHWIAFGLLAVVGLNMIYSAAKGGDEDDRETGTGMSFMVLIATAVGTSLDAMAVGVSLAFLDVNILVIAAAIGFATFLLSSSGMLIGRLIGGQFGRLAEGIAGIALIGLGSSILYDHLSAAAV